jgi:hypothetical protein
MYAVLYTVSQMLSTGMSAACKKKKKMIRLVKRAKKPDTIPLKLLMCEKVCIYTRHE